MFARNFLFTHLTGIKVSCCVVSMTTHFTENSFEDSGETTPLPLFDCNENKIKDGKEKKSIVICF